MVTGHPTIENVMLSDQWFEVEEAEFSDEAKNSTVYDSEASSAW